MTQREEIAAGGGTFSDTMHIVLSAVTVLLILSQIGFGAAAFVKRFRLYSILTAATVLVSGALTAMQSPKIEAGEPTPWLGLAERISIGAWLLWIAVLAVALFARTKYPRPPGGRGGRLPRMTSKTCHAPPANAMIPSATRRPPVTRSARFPWADRQTPIPKAIISTLKMGSMTVRNGLVGAPLADSSLTA